MAKPMKHIGRHGDRNVAVIFREIPNQEHMCLVVYPGTLSTPMHDSLMKAIESTEAQAENSLSDALHRMLFSDGRPILDTLHREGYLKKVEAKQVYMTPNPKSSVNLAEMNEIINQMSSGEEAKQKLAKLDAERGLKDPAKTTSVNIVGTDGALSDIDLAKQQLDQASKMEAESKSLLAESKRLKKEAYKLDATLKPKPKVTKKPAAKKTTAKKTTAKKTTKSKTTA